MGASDKPKRVNAGSNPKFIQDKNNLQTKQHLPINLEISCLTPDDLNAYQTPVKSNNITQTEQQLPSNHEISCLAPEELNAYQTPAKPNNTNLDINKQNETFIDKLYEEVKLKELKVDIIQDLKEDILMTIKNEIKTAIAQTLKTESRNNINTEELESLKNELKAKENIIESLSQSLSKLTAKLEQFPSTTTISITSEKEKEKESLDDSLICTTAPKKNHAQLENKTFESAVEFTDIETPKNTQRLPTTISTQLENFREKHKQDYKIWKEKEKQPPKEKEEVSKEKHHWKNKTTLIVGDSIISGINENKMKKHNVKVRVFRGASCEDMKHYIKPLLKKKPTNIIMHIGTNNTPNDNSRSVLDKILSIKALVKQELPSCNIIISNLVNRYDNGKASLTTKNVNELLETVNIDIIRNNNITSRQLVRGLHLNQEGSGKLALNFIKKIKEFEKY